ncbi:MAG: hypothetical protein AAGI38_16200 [Bacteroidota bacterium]
MELITRASSLRDVLNHNPLLELVLDRFDLVYRNNDQTVEIACMDKCLNIDFFVEILRVFDHPEQFSVDTFSAFEVGVIMEYLEKTHEYYINKRTAEIEHSIELLIERYSDDYPRLVVLKPFFQVYKKELIEHITTEEEELFPYIREQIQAYSGAEVARNETGFSISKFLHRHEEDHLDTDLGEIRNLIIDGHPELMKVLAFRVLFTQLYAFESDLHIHERIEEEVLIPKLLRPGWGA